MLEFSVLMSVYKNEISDHLKRSLESISLNQKIKPTGIIIIKDGPLNKNLDNVLLSFKEQHPNIVKIIDIPVNVGLGNALNEGLKHCSNNWVFRMDTDDYCQPDRFEKQIKYIQDNPDVVLLGSSTEEFDSNLEKSLGLRNPPTSHNEILHYAKKRNPFNHMTVAFRKDVIEQVGGYQHHLYMEDYNLWIRVIAAGHKVANLSDVLVNVRGGDSMIKRRKGLVYIKSELQLAKLKIEHKIDSPINAYLTFMLRSIPRLLPTSILSQVYKNLRK
ncbi:glycosyltransferase [Providencia alcalifaciens]|uniref:glycosyltransferase n=1 Tax=Providencia alcalifaciens TaxID=126385 RepID=UPI0003E1BBF5|nr:glycosyltransferase [Providencia alcalifaciens]ETT01288.1 glycosyltransferase-like protein, family 2 [Providencia alcalifaciens PAL-3]EUC99097.1 glycosyltransferase-like protein, family 2 [Providencia alcalifaciens PAL-1]